MNEAGEDHFATYEAFGNWNPMQSVGAIEAIASLTTHRDLIQRYVLDQSNVDFRSGKVIRFPTYEDNDVVLRDLWLYGLEAGVNPPPGTSSKPTPSSYYFALLFGTADPKIGTGFTVIYPGTIRPKKISLITEIQDATGSIVDFNDSNTIQWACGQTNTQIRSFKSRKATYDQFSRARLRLVGGEYFKCS